MNKLVTFAKSALGASVLLLAVGCLESATVVSVKKDGSATVVVREFMSPQIAGMMGGMGNMFGEGGGGSAPPAPKDMFKESAEKKAGTLGEGAKMISYAPKKNKAGWTGYMAKYSIPDVNKLTLKLGGDMGGGGGAAGGGGGGGDDMAYTFAFDKGSTAKLKVIPAEKKEKAGGGGGGPGDDAMGAAMMQQMASMFAGMRLTMMVMVEGDIKDTNATYQSAKKKNLVTIMDLPVDKLLAHPEGMKAMMNDKDPDQFKQIAALKIPEVKVADMEKTVTIDF